MNVGQGGQLSTMPIATSTLPIYVFTVKALEIIVLGLHKDVYSSEVTSGWEGKYRADASGLLTGLEQFQFIITFLTVYQYLSHLKGITIKLQST